MLGILFFCKLTNANFRVVLTGGAGVGKSTVINLLAQHGYQTIPEVWTLLFNEAKQANRAEAFLLPSFLNSSEFRIKMMDVQLLFENSLEKEKITFLDRSTIDIVAYGYFYDIEMSEAMINVPKNNKYDLIFFLDPLPIELYHHELCDSETSLRQHEHIKKFYKDLGYNIIEVPFDSPEERMKFILKSTLQKRTG